MGAVEPASRPSRRTGVVRSATRAESCRAGALAGSAALFVLLVLPPLLGGQGFLELVHSGATAFVPVPVFETALRILGPAAKGLLFAGTAAAVPLCGSLLALVTFRLPGLGSPIDGRRLGLLAALVAWLAGEVLVLPFFGQGFFGAEARVDGGPLQASFALACLAYGFVLGGLVGSAWEDGPGLVPLAAAAGLVSGAPSVQATMASAAPAASSASPMVPSTATRLSAVDAGRRRFLVAGVAVLGWASLAGSGLLVLARVLGGLRTVTRPRPQAAGGFGPTPRLTPVADFYVVSKNVLLPTVDAATWRLRVDGLVERPRSFGPQELRRLPRVEGERTLECISNEVVSWSGLIGNQRWAGVRLLDILAEVGVRPQATHTLWRSADGYTESLPLAEVDDGVWLVDEMGPPGTPLPPEHGFPLRVLVPGRYGMKQPKWLTGIELADHDEPGFWVQRGWNRAAVVRTWSRIDEPRSGDVVPVGRPFTVFGVAFAGERGIGRLEVSADDGRTWRDAELEGLPPGVGSGVWRRWRTTLEVGVAGPAILVVRATDGLGAVQEATAQPPLPAGATGYHRVKVEAIEVP